MKSKFLYFKKRNIFDALVDSIPEELSPICFIEDSNEIWFNGHFFQAGHESLRVSEMNNTVTVALSESYFTIVPGSTNISVRAQDNAIVVSSNALTRIDTDDQLEWKDNKLYHKESGIVIGSYGPNSSQTGANILSIPKISFNKYGHATDAETISITIRDYVEQRNADSSNIDRQLLLSERNTEESDTNITRKAKGLTYNNSTKILKAGNLEIEGTQEKSVIVKQGDLVVENGTIIGKLKGEVTGTATPKIHLSDKGEYGGASKNLLGHVKLVDTINGIPAPSSDNTDTNNSTTVAEAASPYLVYNYVQANKFKVGGINANKVATEITDRVDFTDDFLMNESTISIRWTEL